MGLSTEADRLGWAACAGSLSVRGRGGTATQATLNELERAASRSA
jgi:ribokinase